MERFKIFPSIGIARLGGSLEDFFLCPETETSRGVEIDEAGNETEIETFKDAGGLIKRQGARFRVFERDDVTGEYLPLGNPPGVSIEWRVRLANKKAGVVRPDNPPTQAPAVPLPLKPNAVDLIIAPSEASISGPNRSGVELDDGKYKNEAVFIGELRTDNSGNLIVLGGRGVSRSPSNQDIRFYYFTEDWFDDVADGYVRATVKLADGSEIAALDSWVIVAPPDFAPAVKGVVTLYDIIQQVAIDRGELTIPQPISYVHHVKPLIERFRNLQWVSDIPIFSIPFGDDELSDPDASHKATRRSVRNRIVSIESTLSGHTNGTPFHLTEVQKLILNKWRDGDFQNDSADAGESQLSAADGLNKTVLDTTVGQGFCPGIEGGIIVENKTIYNEPFRLDTTKISPGDITALMALPWQSDFLECNTNWWPSQRPDKVLAEDGSKVFWTRGFPQDNAHEFMIANFQKLGFVIPKNTAAGLQQIEEERGVF